MGRTGFDNFWSLRDVFLEVRTGERLSILDGNGSGGSSVLLNVCSLKLEKTSGKGSE